MTVEDRFWAKVDVGFCWLWTGATNPKGYGRFNKGSKVQVYPHRWLWEHLVGPIPAGLDLDHLCRVHGCVNPDHLEPVTRRENIMRGNGPQVFAAKNNAKTHCPRNHPYSGVNVQGSRICRTCMNAASRRYKEKGLRPAIV